MSQPGSTGPVRVAVLGSCISRDAFNSRFNPGYKQMWDCVLIQNQSSLISLMSEPLAFDEDDFADGTSEYDRWNVRTDTSKRFLTDVVEAQPEYLILDFFGDIHFGVLELDDGRFITNNRWKLWPTKLYQRLKEEDRLHPVRIERDTERYLELWRDAYDRLVGYLRTRLPDTTFVVHRGHNTNTVWLEDEQRTVRLTSYKKLWKINVPKLNELWSRLDDYAISSTDFASIDLLAATYPSFPGHPWGPFYVHYTLDYYHDFLAALGYLHLEKRLRAEGRDHEALMLAQLRESAAGRREVDVGRLDIRLGRVRSRLEEAERRLEAGLPARARRAARRLLGRPAPRGAGPR